MREAVLGGTVGVGGKVGVGGCREVGGGLCGVV